VPKKLGLPQISSELGVGTKRTLLCFATQTVSLESSNETFVSEASVYGLAILEMNRQ